MISGEAARGLGIQIVVVRAGKADDLDDAFATLVHQGARALIIGSDTYFTSQRSQISIRAARHSLPNIWVTRIEVEAGGLMSYGANIPDVYRHALQNGIEPNVCRMIWLHDAQLYRDVSTLAEGAGVFTRPRPLSRS